MKTGKDAVGATSKGCSSLSNYNPYIMTTSELNAKARTYVRRGKRYWLPMQDKKFPNVYTEVEMECIELCNARHIIDRTCSNCVNVDYCRKFERRHGYKPDRSTDYQSETIHFYINRGYSKNDL